MQTLAKKLLQNPTYFLLNPYLNNAILNVHIKKFCGHAKKPWKLWNFSASKLSWYTVLASNPCMAVFVFFLILSLRLWAYWWWLGCFWIFCIAFCYTGIPTTRYVNSHPPTQRRARQLHPPPPASSYTAVVATISVVGNVPSYGSTNQPSHDSAVTSQYAPQNALLDDKLITNRSTIDTA